MRLSFNNDDIIYYDNNGNYEVPDTIETPVRLERFEVADGAITEVDLFRTMTNAEIDAYIIEKDNFNLESEKVRLKQKLWNILPKKTIGAKKIIIGKPDMSDSDLEVQLDLYLKKYEDAKAGLNVFEGQALAKKITQEEYRATVILKGDAFLEAEKKINDMIELTRSLLEENINSMVSKEDRDLVLEKFLLVDGFTIFTSVGDIVTVLK